MGLDIAILDKSTGTPLKSVGMSLSNNSKLIELLEQHDGMLLLSRMKKFYEDGIYFVNELTALRVEVESIITNVTDVKLRNFLIELRSLIDFAILFKAEIHLIAD